MSHDRFIHHDVASLGIEANIGIDLTFDGQILSAAPRRHPDADHPAPAPFSLPPIPAPLLENSARLLRRLALHGHCGMWALYIDTMPPHAWHFYLPPQLCSADGTTANISYPGCQVPGSQLRLAGTLRSALRSLPDQLATELPPVDGVHLCLHPEGWLLLSAFLVMGGVTHAVVPHYVIADPIDSELQALSSRLWGLNPL